ncbi:MAG: hypothetical protein BGO98_18625 [Myxococcales bacterium 68-20]|nr:hypothetical protein [Myxococcales bacterium]OJY24658.1 MAG: hypothetical protein BGO98_18625 [Myxococcales bacterium 68-20]
MKLSITDRNVNELPIPNEDENGWSFDDPQALTKVILRGTACSATTGAPSGRVDVVIGCRIPY